MAVTQRMDLPKLPPGKRFTLPRPVGSADALLLAARDRKPWPIALGILAATLVNHAISAWLGAELTDWLSPEVLLQCGAQPWRCLCRGLSQITMTLPWRRITLHLSQIFLTLGLTFMG